jgi:distribution and morphology protein 31
MASIFFLLNSLQMQEWLAAKLGAYMTDSTGIMVVFESAIVPRFSWTDSKITFKNVSIQRGAPAPAAEAPTSLQELFPVAALSDDHESTLRRFRRRASSLVRGSQKAPVKDEPDFSRTTYFQLSINEIEVSLSLPRWLDGKGIVKEAVIKGVRGLVDRRHIRYDPAAKVDRLAYRHTAKPGDFHLEGLQVDDFLVTIYQPNDFRPYTCSIFAATIPVLRKQWLFLDLMSADSITGQIDNCLFSLHRPQSLSTSFMSEDAADHKASQWSKLSRFRIDGFNIDHLQSPHDQGALAWITAGKCDLVADIRFPRKEDENDSFEAIIGQIADSIDQQVLQGPKLLAGQKELSVGTALEAPEPFVSTRTRLGLDDSVKSTEDQPEPVIVIDLSVRFKDVKASIPVCLRAC